MLGSSKRPYEKRFEGGRVRKLSANNSLTRQRAVVRLSSDPRAVNQKVKLCKLVIKTRRHWIRDLEISLPAYRRLLFPFFLKEKGRLRNDVANRFPVFQDLGKGL